MKKIFLIFILVILISNASASCSEGQIDINNATKEKLDEIVHVGPAVAGYIIDARPFSSLDELVNVSYISLGYLEEIKNQGLACVDNEGDNKEGKEIENNGEENDTQETPPTNDADTGQEPEESITETISTTDNDNGGSDVEIRNKKIEAEVIKLIPKDIKTDENTESSNKNIYAISGFVIFCILLAFLFLLRKKKFKNEFD